MSSFDTAKFSDTYPVAFAMRVAHPDTWFRIHSLPDSKRYPESDADWDILISRHRRLSSAVMGGSGRCRIHYSLFADADFPSSISPSLDWRASSAIPFDDEQKVFTKTTEADWSFDTFLPWIRMRSEDELAWIAFHSLDTDAIYSPYDGGADIFSTDDRFLSDIKTEFSKWASPQPAGL